VELFDIVASRPEKGGHSVRRVRDDPFDLDGHVEVGLKCPTENELRRLVAELRDGWHRMR
jgi:hypothetical protein